MKTYFKFNPFPILFFCVIIGVGQLSLAQEEEATSGEEEPTMTTEEVEPTELPLPLIRDVNGNGAIDIIAFGDSITRGVGDFTDSDEEVTVPSFPEVEAGYPLRVERFLNVGVQNRGVSGEVLSTEGLSRFASLIPQARPDFVILSGGTNDAQKFTSDSNYSRSVQTMLNIAHAVGTVPIIATITPVCCDRAGFRTTITSYNRILRSLANSNKTEVADINHAYENTCGRQDECRLLNLPEGEHPNTDGYDVSGEVVTSTLLNIDIFATDGPTLLSQALGVPVASIKTVPDPITQTPRTSK